MQQEEIATTPPPPPRQRRRLGSFRRNSHANTTTITESSTNNSNTKSESVAVKPDVLLEEAALGSLDILCRRPHVVSVTLVKDSPETPLGFRLSSHHDQVFIEDKTSSSLLCMPNPCALFPHKQNDHSLTFFQSGDVLESINNFECRGVEPHEIEEYFDSLQAGLITIMVSTTNNKNEQQQEEESSYRLCQAIALRPEQEEHEEAPFDTAADTTTTTDNILDPGITFDQDSQGRLVIQTLAPQGWFGGRKCALQAGDFVVGINDCPCFSIGKQEAQLLLAIKAGHSPFVSITTLRPPKSTAWGLRKTAVALGGGTMVGVGAVIMATPLHPIGHVMAAGGVAALGTEFEAPKRAVESAKKKWKGMTSRNSDNEDESDESALAVHQQQ